MASRRRKTSARRKKASEIMTSIFNFLELPGSLKSKFVLGKLLIHESDYGGFQFIYLMYKQYPVTFSLYLS